MEKKPYRFRNLRKWKDFNKKTGAPNENIVENRLNIALLNAF